LQRKLRDSGRLGQWFLHRATQRLCWHGPTTVLSGSRSGRLLAVPYSETGPQGDRFRDHGGYQIKRDGRTPEDSNKIPPPVLPAMAGSIEQVRAQGSYCQGHWISVAVMSHHSGAMSPFRELPDCLSYFGKGMFYSDRLCGLVVRVLGYRSGGPG
jgi:hypothetical protein